MENKYLKQSLMRLLLSKVNVMPRERIREASSKFTKPSYARLIAFFRDCISDDIAVILNHTNFEY